MPAAPGWSRSSSVRTTRRRSTCDEIAAQGAKVWLVNGLINDCGRIVGEGKSRGLVRRLHAQGAVPHRGQEDDGPRAGRPARLDAARRHLLSHRRRHRPDRHVEGVRRAGAASAGSTRSGRAWSPFKPPAAPRSCGPSSKASITRRAWEDAHTIAAGIRVPAAIGDFLMLRAIRESNGFAIAVDDEAILAARDEVARTEGLLMCPEGAATYAAYKECAGRRPRDARRIRRAVQLRDRIEIPAAAGPTRTLIVTRRSTTRSCESSFRDGALAQPKYQDPGLVLTRRVPGE